MRLRSRSGALLVGLLLAAPGSLAPRIGHAAALDLTTLTCDRYQHEVMNPTAATPAPAAEEPGGAGTLTAPTVDPINTMMWLFGFSVAKSGAHVMYGDALAAFGFALDGQCIDHPSTLLLDALTAVKLKHDNPMDLMTLSCDTFETRHMKLKARDAESADTIMMWLFGYASERNGSRTLDADGLRAFDVDLQKRCLERPQTSVFDALTGPAKPLAPAKKPAGRTSVNVPREPGLR